MSDLIETAREYIGCLHEYAYDDTQFGGKLALQTARTFERLIDRLLEAEARAERAESAIRTARRYALREAAELVRPIELCPDELSPFHNDWDRGYWHGQNDASADIEELSKQKGVRE